MGLPNTDRSALPLSVPWWIGESGHRRLPRAVLRSATTLSNRVGSCEALAQQQALGRANNSSSIVTTLELRSSRRARRHGDPFI